MATDTYMRASDGTIFYALNPEWHKGCESLKRADGLRLYREQCIDELRKMLPEGTRVHTVLRHVSQSGMRREISCLVVHDGELRGITHQVAFATSRALGKRGGVMCNGCGMDMGFDLVYSLSAALFDGERAGYRLKHDWI